MSKVHSFQIKSQKKKTTTIFFPNEPSYHFFFNTSHVLIKANSSGEQISDEEILYDADFSHKVMPRTQGEALTHHYSSAMFKDVVKYIPRIFVVIADTAEE